jgi:hypothetical protein
VQMAIVRPGKRQRFQDVAGQLFSFHRRIAENRPGPYLCINL